MVEDKTEKNFQKEQKDPKKKKVESWEEKR